MSKIGISTGGILFPTPITMNERGDGHLARAALESISYTIKARLSQLENILGHKPKNVYLGGGMAKSDTFTRIISNVLNRDIYVANSYNANAIGGFIAGTTAIKEYPSLIEAANQTIAKLNVKTPEPIEALEYQGLYDNWKTISAKLSSLNN